MNRATLIGHVGADPEVRATTNGNRVATLTLATSREWKNAKGEKQEQTQWHRLILWNSPKGAPLADLAEKYVGKGDRLMVEGEIIYRSWDDKDGNTRYITEVVVRDMMFLSSKKAPATPAPASAPKKEKADPQAPIPSLDDALPPIGEELPF